MKKILAALFSLSMLFHVHLAYSSPEVPDEFNIIQLRLGNANR